MSRPAVVSCYVFGGRTKDGKRVGSRHRWLEGWGKGRCDYCGRYLEDILERKVSPPRSLEEIIKDAK